jgi:hypothetical protein
MAVIAVLTGMVRYDRLDLDAPLANAFEQVGLGWAKLLIALAGVAGITTVLLVLLLSLPRILLAMARDGLLPARIFAAVHPRFRTPYKATLATGLLVGATTAFLPIDVVVNLAIMGTLFIFVVVCAAIPVMRRASLPGALVAAGPAPGRRDLPLHDVQPAGRELAAPADLAGARHGDLSRLRPPPQRPGEPRRRRRRRRRRAIDSFVLVHGSTCHWPEWQPGSFFRRFAQPRPGTAHGRPAPVACRRFAQPSTCREDTLLRIPLASFFAIIAAGASMRRPLTRSPG